jgi:hypothetical protein
MKNNGDDGVLISKGMEGEGVGESDGEGCDVNEE